MNSHQLNYTRFAVGNLVYYSLRGGTEGDATPREIIAMSFRIIRNWLNRGRTLDEALRHIDSLAISASLA